MKPIDFLERDVALRDSAAPLRSGDALAAQQRQVLVTAFLSLFCVVGLALWGLPFFYDFMVRQFGWTHAQVTSGNALSKIVVGPLFGFLAGYIVDRFGARHMLMAGIVMAGAALIALAGASTLGFFRLFYFLNALGYIFGGPLPVQVLLARWFDKSRGKAMGVAYLGIGLGGALAPWIATLLVSRYGWQAALATMGAFIISSPAFYLLAAGSMCSIAAVAGTQQTLKLFLSLDQHYAQAEAARIISLVLACSMAGRLLMGWLADRWPKKRVMLLIYLLVVAGIPLLFLASARPAVYLFAVVFGLGLGGEYMIIPLMTAEIFGVQVLGRLMGIILAADGVAEAVAPWLAGNLRDSTGSYVGAFSMFLAVALIGAVAVAALPARRTAS